DYYCSPWYISPRIWVF
nr:immunoglobulin light chain junction region [Macaca mulatta]MOX11919.1 immunoglobulin light chain junction region [Macaca mulatta]MOX14340.1 immunoglobulin light chain junction region [Macaca mulatta]